MIVAVSPCRIVSVLLIRTGGLLTGVEPLSGIGVVTRGIAKVETTISTLPVADAPISGTVNDISSTSFEIIGQSYLTPSTTNVILMFDNGV